MMSDPKRSTSVDLLKRAEEVYIDIYARVAAKADYLQPADYRQLLAESAIIGAVASALVGMAKSFVEGFLKRAGETAAERAAARVLSKLQKDAPQPSDLAFAIADLLLAIQSAPPNWDEATAAIELELTRKGVALASARDMASDVVAGIKRHLPPGDA